LRPTCDWSAKLELSAGLSTFLTPDDRRLATFQCGEKSKPLSTIQVLDMLTLEEHDDFAKVGQGMAPSLSIVWTVLHLENARLQ
jgi:hypothetical protein